MNSMEHVVSEQQRHGEQQEAPRPLAAAKAAEPGARWRRARPNVLILMEGTPDVPTSLTDKQSTR